MHSIYSIHFNLSVSPEQVSLGLEALSLGLGESFEHWVCESFGLCVSLGLCVALRFLSSADSWLLHKGDGSLLSTVALSSRESKSPSEKQKGTPHVGELCLNHTLICLYCTHKCKKKVDSHTHLVRGNCSSGWVPGQHQWRAGGWFLSDPHWESIYSLPRHDTGVCLQHAHKNTLKFSKV